MFKEIVSVVVGLSLSGVANAQDLCPTNPDKDEPGYCGCDYLDVDTNNDSVADACVHMNAFLDPTAVIGMDSTVNDRATIGASSSLGAGSVMAPRSTLGAGSLVGPDAILGRQANVGSSTDVGEGSTIGRNGHVGNNVDAIPGYLTLGYAATLGDDCRILGPYVTMGNLASIEGGLSCTVGEYTVLARSASVGADVALGERVSLGPETTVADGTVIGNDVRIRKNVTILDGVQIGHDVRIGRNTVVHPSAQIGAGATLRSEVTIGENAIVEPNAYIRRGTVIDGVLSNVNLPPTVTVTSPSGPADSSSGTVNVAGTLSDDTGTITSVTYRVDDGTELTLGVFDNTSFSAAIPVDSSATSIRVTAYDEEGLPGSRLILLNNCAQTGFDHVWTGASSEDWNDAANWEGVGVPNTTSDDVFICGELSVQPELASDVSVRSITMTGSATLDTNGHRIDSQSSVIAGRIDGGGVLGMNGGTLRGVVPNLDINGTVSLSGFTHTLGDTTLESGNTLNVNQRTLLIDGNFSQNNNSTSYGLRMYQANDDVRIAGDATFTGTASTMQNGILRIEGDLTAASRDSFKPTSAHVTRLQGTSPQHVQFFYSNTGDDHFAYLHIANDFTFGVDGSTLQLVADHIVVEAGQTLAMDTIQTSTLVVEDGARVEGLAGARIASPAFSGNVTIHGTGSIYADTIQFGGACTFDDNAVLDANVVRINNQFCTAVDGYQVGRTEIYGNITLQDNLSVQFTELSVVSGGQLVPNNHSLVIDGNFSQSNSSTSYGLRMYQAGDDVRITGDATFTGTASTMQNGILRIEGDLTAASRDSFKPTSAHVTRLQGTSPQHVQFFYSNTGDDHFAYLHIANDFTFGVDGSTLQLVADHIVVEAGQTLAMDTIQTNTLVVEDGARVEGLAGARIASPAFSGNVTINGTGSIFADTIQFGGACTFDADAVLDANVARINNQFCTAVDGYQVGRTEIYGNITLQDNLAVQFTELSVVSGGQLVPNNHSLVIDGNFSQSNSSTSYGLRMYQAGDDVRITGDAAFTGSASTMQNGILRIEGDLTAASRDAFQPTSAHVTRLQGTSPQHVQFFYSNTGDDHFANLHIANDFTFGVDGSTLQLVADHIVVEAGQTLAMDTIQTSTLVVEDGARVEGIAGARIASPAFSGNVTINGTGSIYADTIQFGGACTFDADAVLDANVARINNQFCTAVDGYQVGRTEIYGNITLQDNLSVQFAELSVVSGGQLVPNNHSLVIDGNFSQSNSSTSYGLRMYQAGDDVRITGDATFAGYASTMQNGILRIEGDLTAASRDAFQPTSAHVTRLQGSAPQHVQFFYSNTGDDHFANLHIANDFTFGVDGLTLQLVADHIVVEAGQTLAMDAIESGTLTVEDGARVEGMGGARLATTSFPGTVTINGTGSIYADTIQFGGACTFGVDAVLDANVARINNQFCTPVDGYQVGRTEIYGNITLQDNLSVQFAELSVVSGGQLVPNNHSLVIDGNFSQSNSSTSYGLRMYQAGDDVRITGDATFAGYASYMTAGILRIEGDLTAASRDAFQPTSAHVTRLQGSAPQHVQFFYSNTSDDHFANLHIANAFTFGVDGLTLQLVADHIVVEAGQTLAMDAIESGTLTVEDGARVEGVGGARLATTSLPGTVTINGTGSIYADSIQFGGACTFGVDAVLDANVVRINNQFCTAVDGYQVGRTEIYGNITLQDNLSVQFAELSVVSGGQLVPNNHSLVIDGNFSQSNSSTSYGLRMYQGSDDVRITGDATFTGYASYMTAGILRIEGDLISESRDAFRPTSAHLTQMQGNGAQSIDFFYGENGDNRFEKLTVAAGSTTTVTPMTGALTRLWIGEDLNVAGTLIIASGNDSTVAGDLNVPAGGVLTNNGTSMVVNGTCSTTSGTVNGPVTCAN